jgi:hypothetical protein
MTFTEFTTEFGFIADLIGIGGAVYSLRIWLKMGKEKDFNEQRIKIQLRMPKLKLLITLPCEIERKHLTRSELQGLFGILPIKPGEGRKITDRYQLSFFSTAEFFNRLKAAQDNENTNVIEIICEEKTQENQFDEEAQFDLEKIRPQCVVENLENLI